MPKARTGTGASPAGPVGPASGPKGLQRTHGGGLTRGQTLTRKLGKLGKLGQRGKAPGGLA